METENFDQLKKLLALKKHEQPPPGYFDSFSSKVLARIPAEEQAQPKSWWQRVLSFNARPLMAGTYGLAVVAMLGFVVTVLVKQPTTSTEQGARRHNVSQPNVNEGSASMPLDNEPNSSIVVASNDSAPSFLFNPNGVFDSNSTFPKPVPANYKQTGE